jgi:hypothetical protein
MVRTVLKPNLRLSAIMAALLLRVAVAMRVKPWLSA